MARATTPTRRPAFGTAAGSSSSSARPLFGRRVTLSGGGSGGSVCSSRPRGTTSSDLPPVRLAPAVVVRGRTEKPCACSPTKHPGSFRCALHRGRVPAAAAAATRLHVGATRRSAMANSLVRIAAVEGGDHVRRALAALIRPSSHHQCRRPAFRPLPSRLSAMSTAASCSPP